MQLVVNTRLAVIKKYCALTVVLQLRLFVQITTLYLDLCQLNY